MAEPIEQIVEIVQRIEQRAGIRLVADDLDRWQRAVKTREPRRGITPGGIEWRG